MAHFANMLALLFAALFGTTALLHLAGPRFLVQAYRCWDYARGFLYVVAGALGFTAVFLAIPQTRIWGVLAAAAILFATNVALLNHRKYICALPVILMMAALIPTLAAN